jgi:hypothetical protein
MGPHSMPKPGDSGGPNHAHYQLHLAHSVLCEWTCSKDGASMHRNGGTVVEHYDPNIHTHHKQLHSFPGDAATLAMAEHLRDELFSHDWHLPPHVYATLYGHVSEAIQHLTKEI